MIFDDFFLLTVILFASPCFAKNEGFYGKISPIPPEVKKMMIGHSWHEGCPIGFDQLSYLQVSYWGFDNKPHVGEIIVYRGIANETVDTFKQLFEIKFPIERMQIPKPYLRDYPIQQQITPLDFTVDLMIKIPRRCLYTVTAWRLILTIFIIQPWRVTKLILNKEENI